MVDYGCDGLSVICSILLLNKYVLIVICSPIFACLVNLFSSAFQFKLREKKTLCKQIMIERVAVIELG